MLLLYFTGPCEKKEKELAMYVLIGLHYKSKVAVYTRVNFHSKKESLFYSPADWPKEAKM
jgi:hypothetical protein